jgi:hypothetical protein
MPPQPSVRGLPLVDCAVGVRARSGAVAGLSVRGRMSLHRGDPACGCDGVPYRVAAPSARPESLHRLERFPSIPAKTSQLFHDGVSAIMDCLNSRTGGPEAENRGSCSARFSTNHSAEVAESRVERLPLADHWLVTRRRATSPSMRRGSITAACCEERRETGWNADKPQLYTTVLVVFYVIIV